MRSNKSCLKGLHIQQVILGHKGYQFYFGNDIKTIFLCEWRNDPVKWDGNINKKIRSLPLRLVWK